MAVQWTSGKDNEDGIGAGDNKIGKEWPEQQRRQRELCGWDE